MGIPGQGHLGESGEGSLATSFLKGVEYIFLVLGVHTLTSLILIMQFVIGLVLVTELPGPGEPGWDGCN